MNEDFNIVDQFLLNRTTLLNNFYTVFPLSECFEYVDYNKYGNVSVDDFAKSQYGNENYYWVLLLFNPDLDLLNIGIKEMIDSGEFIRNKLDTVYIEELKQSSYSPEQITKVFDLYNNSEVRTLLLPKKDYLNQVEKYLTNKFNTMAT